MERTKKLGACLAAAVTILAGATYLSTPAQAAEVAEEIPGCDIDFMKFLREEVVPGVCGASGGHVTYCNQEAFEVHIECW